MKITIINSEKKETSYSRVELDEFIVKLKTARTDTITYATIAKKSVLLQNGISKTES